MKIELGSAEFWQRLDDDPKRLAVEICTIDATRLDVALARHAALTAWVGGAYEVARIEVARAKRDLAKLRSRFMLDRRLDPETGRPKAAHHLRAEVDVDPAVDAATECFLAAQQRCRALGAITEALDDRKDLLVQLSVNRRSERGAFER